MPRLDEGWVHSVSSIDHADELAQLAMLRFLDRVPINEPLVLVSQLQRSGGTLLAQLFDGHPQCHAHPPELTIGHPGKADWPRLDLAAGAATWFERLAEPRALRAFWNGYRKSSRRSDNPDVEVFPLLLPPTLQRGLFLRCLAGVESPSVRAVFDAYFTSFFNGWLDNANLRSGPKRAITAFTPRLGLEAGNREQFFATYPDGVLVGIVRDPRGWFASARLHDPVRYGDLEAAMQLWNGATTSLIEAKQVSGLKVRLLAFESLVDEPEVVLRRLAPQLGLDYDDCLSIPTFNGRPIRANSSFRVERYGILTEPGDRYQTVLTAEELRRIDVLARDIQERALEAVRQDG